jgi:hypothetical protein
MNYYDCLAVSTESGNSKPTPIKQAKNKVAKHAAKQEPAVEKRSFSQLVKETHAPKKPVRSSVSPTEVIATPARSRKKAAETISNKKTTLVSEFHELQQTGSKRKFGTELSLPNPNIEPEVPVPTFKRKGNYLLSMSRRTYILC